MRPLVIYLDTNDYSAFSSDQMNAKDAFVYDFLMKKLHEKEIVIGFSFQNLFELMQDFSPEHFQDRINRMNTIHNMCGNNAFRFPENLDSDVFTNDGRWYPLEWERTADKKILQDPRAFMITFFSIGKSNTYVNLGHDMTEKVRKFSEDFAKICEQHEAALQKAKEDLKKLVALYNSRPELAETIIPGSGAIVDQWKEKVRSLERLNVRSVFGPEILGEYFIDILEAYHGRSSKDKGFKPRKSDFVDMLHAIYIPHCDVWRGDGGFSNILLSQKIKHSERIVAKRSDLPNFIQSLIQGRK